MNLNKAIIVGRVVRDPETKALPSGSQVANFSVATSRVYKQDNAKKEETEFHNIVAFGRTAEIVGQYVTKGQLILIEGRIQTRSWEKDGHKNYRTEIVCDQMQMGPKPDGAKKAAPATSTKSDGDPGPSDEGEVNPEDLPW